MSSNVFIVLESLGFAKALMRASRDLVGKPIVIDEPRRSVGYQTIPLSGVSGGTVRRMVHMEEDIRTEIPAITEPLDMVRANHILAALTNELLSQILRYRQHECPNYAIARALRNVAVPQDIDQHLAEIFLSHDVVDETWMELSRQVNYFVSGEPWREWQIVNSQGVLALVGGQDYRITEYERAHGTDPHHNDTVLVETKIDTVANYIRQQIAHRIGTAAAAFIPIRALIVLAIREHYPLMAFEYNEQIPFDQLQDAFGQPFGDFMENYIRPVVGVMLMNHLQTRVEAGTPYRGEITQDFTLRVESIETDDTAEALICEDIKRSLDNGDWVPPRDRERLAAYERR